MKRICCLFLFLAMAGIVFSDPDIVEYGNPTIRVKDELIIVTLFLENRGSPMTTPYIIELQPRKPGSQPLALISDMSVCDKNHPENVHVSFQLDTGEKAQIELTTSPAVGKNDLYILGRTKCYNAAPLGNERIGPWGAGQKIGTVTTNDGILSSKMVSLMVGLFVIVACVYVALGRRRQ